MFGETLRDIWSLEIYNSGGNTVRLSQIVIAILVILVGTFLCQRIAKLIGKELRRRSRVDENTAHLFQKLLFYILLLLVILIALPLAGIPITILTVLGGALAIGVGFGAQHLFNNLISSLIILLEQPIRIGDILEIGDAELRVEDIGVRCVRLRRNDGVDLLVPSSVFLQEVVVNWTLSDDRIRGKVRVGAAYGSDTQRVKDLLLQAASQHERVLPDPPSLVLFRDFGDSALIFDLLFWAQVKRPMDLRMIQSDLRFQIDQIFAQNQIVIAFPQQDVHFDPTPLQVQILDKKSD